MKRLAAVLLSLMLLTGGCMNALAEQPAMPQGFPGGNMPGGGTPPDMPGGSSGFPAMPDGGTAPDMPEGFDFGNFSMDDFGESLGGGFSGFPGASGEKAEGQLGSWGDGGKNADTVEGDDYAYDAALYVTGEGIDADKSAADRISAGAYDGSAASGLVIEDSVSGHNGVLVTNADYTISGARIDLLTDADGTDTCDFSGKGAAVAAFGSDARVTVENTEIHTSGVAVTPLFADDGATLTVRNSVLRSDGGTLYSGYLNTPSQSLMVAPPWILGIMGTSRCSNMMGDNTTTNVIDSETSAGAWAVLSTDSGSNMYLNVVNSSLTLNNADESQYPLQAAGGQISETLDNPYTVNWGTGYGTFVIGSAVETFLGADLYVGTYAAILNGGTASYAGLEAGKTYELMDGFGGVSETYTAAEDKATFIHSDTFGFMSLQNTNKVTLEQGTKLETGDASFLVKTGYGGQNTTATVNGADIVNGGVLIQVMDNDDATNGGMMKADDPQNTNSGAMNFIPYHTEDAGFDTASAAQDSARQVFTFTNGAYTGNIYNASGSDGLNASALDVTFGENAVYTGAIASTSAIHVTYEGAQAVKATGGSAFDNADEAAAFAAQYQNTYFTINEYWSIGHVANLVNDNGGNQISVTLTDGAVWNVTGTSLIASLTLGEGCRVIVPAGVTLTVNGVAYTDCSLE